MTYTLIQRDDLPRDDHTYEFEGAQYDSSQISFIWVEMPSGDAIRLHKHAYKEIFIIQEGTATFTVGEDVIEGRAGHIIIVPAEVPHKFANTGTATLRQIDLHLSTHIRTEWLEE